MRPGGITVVVINHEHWSWKTSLPWFSLPFHCRNRQYSFWYHRPLLTLHEQTLVVTITVMVPGFGTFVLWGFVDWFRAFFIIYFFIIVMLLVLRFTVFTSVSFSVKLLCCVFQLGIFVTSCFNLTQLFLVWCLDLLPSPIIRLIVFSRVFTCSTFPSLSGVYTVWVFLRSLLHHCCRLGAPLFGVLVLAVLLRLYLFSLYYLKVFSDTYQNNIKLCEFITAYGSITFLPHSQTIQIAMTKGIQGAFY